MQDEGSYERNLGPIVRDPSVLIGNYCSYVDVHDLADAVVLAIETDLPGHEVFYVASPDTIGGHPLAGAESSGVENARADLFEGARWYLTPTPRSSGVLYDRLQRTVADLGARPEAIDYQPSRFPGAFTALERILVLPWNERYTEKHVEYIAASICKAVAKLQRNG